MPYFGGNARFFSYLTLKCVNQVLLKWAGGELSLKKLEELNATRLEVHVKY